MGGNMRLKNKKTGKVIEWFNNTDGIFPNSLAELCAEWEDYGEPDLVPDQIFLKGSRVCIDYKSVRAAEKALEKLEAWERLRKKHFKFDEYDILNQTVTWLVSREYDEYSSDIDLLFRGEK